MNPTNEQILALKSLNICRECGYIWEANFLPTKLFSNTYIVACPRCAWGWDEKNHNPNLAKIKFVETVIVNSEKWRELTKNIPPEDMKKFQNQFEDTLKLNIEHWKKIQKISIIFLIFIFIIGGMIYLLKL